MIHKDGLLLFYEYDTYANRLVLAVMAKLSQAEFERLASPSHGSVRDLFVHMLQVQSGYLGYCERLPAERPTLSTISEVQTYCQRIGDETQAFIRSSSEADLTQSLEISLGGRPFHFQVWQLLLQPIVHSTHHRGELSIIMTELGYPLPTLDIIMPFAEQSGQLWPWK